MIYKDILKEKVRIIRPIVQRFIYTALTNQSHPGDLFLIFMNGYYDDDNLKNKYVYGTTWEDIAEKSFEKYVKYYLQNENYTKQKKVNIDCNTPEFEDYLISIHNEKSIYLRYWEADNTLNNLYQLLRLCNGLPYDWKWMQKIEKYKCRQEFIRKNIKLPSEKFDQELYQFFCSTIKRQIRNAIAHSQYCLLNNDIKYLNYKKDDLYSQLILLKYSEWEEIIHNTIVFRNELVNSLNQAHITYIQNAMNNNDIIEIRMIKEIEEFAKVNIRFKD